MVYSETLKLLMKFLDNMAGNFHCRKYIDVHWFLFIFWATTPIIFWNNCPISLILYIIVLTVEEIRGH